ncbi:MAG: pyridoxal-phosphate dependent enzyme [Patescibacteria group bacterium]|nr:pyridoxal-phosphate dependent enzyme [Patescibacteria group bacterium]
MNLIDIHKAAHRIKPFIKRTPLIKEEILSVITDKNIFLKLENLQITHAFKIRGNANVIPLLSTKLKRHGLITASTGNHGIGFSYISGIQNIAATVVVPMITPKSKIETI